MTLQFNPELNRYEAERFYVTREDFTRVWRIIVADRKRLPDQGGPNLETRVYTELLDEARWMLAGGVHAHFYEVEKLKAQLAERLKKLYE